MSQRSRDWVKIKSDKTLDCVVAGFTPSEARRAKFGSLLLGLYDERGRLLPMGHVGTGWNDVTRGEIETLARGTG